MTPTTFAKAIARKLVQVVFVVLVLPILYCVEPFFKLRFGHLNNQRIGHLTINTEIFLRRHDQDGWPPRTRYLFAVWKPANQQLLTMIRRRCRVLPNRTFSRLFYLLHGILKKTRFFEPLPWSDQHPGNVALLNDVAPAHSFTCEEEERGRALLESMGISKNDWFVCFHGRDSEYFNEWRPELADHWAKTCHRNSAIKTYLQAAQYITEQGGFAIRVGRSVEAPLPETKNPRIIDYATKHWSDFGDIYLPAKNRFFLCCSSGLAYVSTIFNVPSAWANLAPLSSFPPRTSDLFMPNLIQNVSDGSLVHYGKAKELGLFDPDTDPNFDEICKSKGISRIANTSEDILNLCKDMLDQSNGITPPKNVRALQEHYKDRYHDYCKNSKCPSIGLISPRFAVKHRDLIV